MLYPNLKKAYGPYLRKDGRKHMVLVFNDLSKRTVSYPKWLIENYLERRLLDDETVDHFDRDFTNDNISNLFIKPRGIHAEEDAKRVKLISFICVWCGSEGETHAHYLEHNARQKKAGPFCGRECSGKYGAELQNNRIKPFPKRKEIKIDREYYYLSKNPRINLDKIFS